MGIPTWAPFHCLGNQYDGRDDMYKRPITIHDHNNLHPFCQQIMKFFIGYRVNGQKSSDRLVVQNYESYRLWYCLLCSKKSF